MNFFKSKNTLLENMTFMALMSAINVIVSLLISFVFYLAIILVLILPLTSILVGLYCKKRYYPLYIICTLLLCFLVTMYDPLNTLFYVFPALISGFVLSFLIRLNVPAVYLVVASSLINLGFNYLFIPVIRFFYGQDVLLTLQSLLGLASYQNFYILVPTLLFIFSFLQSLLSILIIKDELKKFNYPINNDDRFLYINVILVVLFTILKIVFSFYFVDFAYLMMALSIIFFGDYFYKRVIKKPKLYIISTAILLFINIFIFLSTYQFMDKTKSFLTIDCFTLLIIIDYFINYKLLTRRKKDKIKA